MLLEAENKKKNKTGKHILAELWKDEQHMIHGFWVFFLALRISMAAMSN